MFDNQTWRSRIFFLVICVISLWAVISLKAAILLQAGLRESERDEKICYVNSGTLKGRIGVISFGKNQFQMIAQQNGVTIRETAKQPILLPVGKPEILKDGEILILGDSQYRFHYSNSGTQDVLLCNERVENLIRTGTSNPFYFALANGPLRDPEKGQLRDRDIIILPEDSEFVSALAKVSGTAIEKGARLARIFPPESDGKFLPHQTKGYRIEVLIPNILTIERKDNVIALQNEIKTEIQNDDVLNFAGRIRLKFSLEKQLITETVNPDVSEQQYLSKASEKITRVNRHQYGVFFKLVRLQEPLVSDKTSIISAWLEDIPAQNKTKIPLQINLSTDRPNLLVTGEANLSLLNPTGYIPDEYTDVQTLRDSRTLVQKEKITLDGNLIKVEAPKKKEAEKLLQAAKSWNRQINPAGLLFWGEIQKKIGQDQWLTSNPSGSESAQKKQHPDSRNIPSQWMWKNIKPEGWPSNISFEGMNHVVIRSELIPPSPSALPPSTVNANWIWDQLPWDFQHSSEEIRYVACSFAIDKEIKKPEDLRWNLVIPAAEVIATLNGKPLLFKRVSHSDEIAHHWQTDVHPSHLIPGKENILTFECHIRPVIQPIGEKYPGIKVRLEFDDQIISTDSSDWEVSVTNYLDWWKDRPHRGNQWLDDKFIRREDTSSFKKLFHPKNDFLGNIPTVWLDEEGVASHGKRIRYFRHPISLKSIPKKAQISFHASGSVTLWLNDIKVSSGSSEAKDINIQQKLVIGKQYINLSAEHPGFENPVLPEQADFEVSDGKVIGLNPKVLRQTNRFEKRQKRGEIIDRDGYSLPRLLVLEGDETTLKKGDLVPLINNRQQSGVFVKDILLINAEHEEFPIDSIAADSDNKGGSLNIICKNGDSPVFLQNRLKKNISAWLYAPEPDTFAPTDPNRYDDAPLKSGFGNPWRNFFPEIGKERAFLFDREHLICRFGQQHKEVFYSKGWRHFISGQVIILDRLNRNVHELEIQPSENIETVKSYPVPSFRVAYSDRKSRIINMSQEKSDSVIYVNSKAVKPGESADLKDGMTITAGIYLFRAELNVNGILAKDTNEDHQRHYQPGLGLSHTVGYYYQSWHGLEEVFQKILKQNGKVSLTLDDDLIHFARNEVLRELDLIQRKKNYQLAVIEKEIEKEKDKLLAEKLTRKYEMIRNFHPAGALIIMNSDGEILATVSEPSVPVFKDALARAHRLDRIMPNESPLVNRAIHDPQWSPGSSMKILTSVSAQKIRNNNAFVENFLSVMKPFDKECQFYGSHSNHLENLKLPNEINKNITTDLTNHENHFITAQMNTLPGALAKSYNVYFGYLGLLMNRTVMFDSKEIENSNRFWWRVFADHTDRDHDFPIIGVAEQMGYNRYISLMHGDIDKRLKRFLPEISISSPIVTKPGYFPINILDQAQASRVVIGEGQVRTTPLLNTLGALTIANNGSRPYPSFIRDIKTATGEMLYSFKPESDMIINNNTIPEIIKGMHWVVNGRLPGSNRIETVLWSPTKPDTLTGTATITFDDCLFKNQIYGKTGTSEGGEDGVDGNSWFISFIKANDGKTYAIGAVFPRAGMGARHAGECVKRVWERMSVYYGWKK